jgi:hypothetical protein
MEFQAAPVLLSVIARMINKTSAAKSRIPSKVNSPCNNQKTRPMPNGKISGNPIGMI